MEEEARAPTGCRGVRSQSQASSCASCLSCPLSALDLGGRWPASSPHPCGGRRALCLVWLRALRVCTQPRHSVHTDSCSSSSSGPEVLFTLVPLTLLGLCGLLPHVMKNHSQRNSLPSLVRVWHTYLIHIKLLKFIR